jgi:hypothetical protein
MAKRKINAAPPDPELATAALHWDDRGQVTEIGNFRRRGYTNLVYDDWTKTTGSPKLIAYVHKDLSAANPLYLGRYLIIRLPFRIRSSVQRSFGLGPEGIPMVSVSNPLSITSDAEWNVLAVETGGELPSGVDPFTWVMIYIGSKRIKGHKLEVFLKDAGDLVQVEAVIQPEMEEKQAALASLNRFIVSYWHAAGDRIENNHLRLLNDADMLREPHAWIGCISNAKETPYAIANELHTFPSTRKPSEKIHLFGERSDLSAGTFTNIATALTKVSDYPAIYFSFAGQGYMRSGDYQNALLYYVMAFESTHQHFLEYAFSELDVPEAEARSNELRMRAGVTTLLKVTMHLLLKVGDRPSKGALERTKKAIELRNSWVHGKRDKSGRLHALQFSRIEISELIKGVVECTNIMLAILP